MQPPRDEAVTSRREDAERPSLSMDTAALEPAAPLPPGDEALNLAERVIARLGAWAGTFAVRFAPPMGPFFAADGRHANDGSRYLVDLSDSSAPQAPLP